MSEFVKQLGLVGQAAGGVFLPTNLLIVAGAVLLGLVVGAIPGLTGTMALALLINLTYKLPSDQAVAFMLGVYVGAVSGGLFSAIMLNIPGTPNAAATALDGYPLAKRGKGGKALFGGVFASCLGTLISCIIMMLATPFLSKIALKFGKWEMFLLAIFGITICGNLSVDCSPLKGWLAGFIGFFVAMIGVEDMYNSARFVWVGQLRSGVELIPALIGIFGIAEVLTVLQDRTPFQVNSDMGTILPDKNELRMLLRPLIRSSLIGCGIGAIPGAGEDIAAWLSYSTGKSRGKDRANFGRGSFEGLACSETANNACIPGAMIPMLTLAVAAIVMVVLALILTKPMVKILQINRKVLMPIIVSLTVVGAYASRSNLFDVKLMLVFGVIGFFLRKLNFPLAPLTLGLILGGTADTNFRQSLTMGGNVLTRVVGDILLVVVLYSLVSGVIKTIKSAKADLASGKQ